MPKPQPKKTIQQEILEELQGINRTLCEIKDVLDSIKLSSDSTASATHDTAINTAAAAGYLKQLVDQSQAPPKAATLGLAGGTVVDKPKP